MDHLGGNVRWISADPLRRDAMILASTNQALREVGPNLTNDACHLTSQSFQTSETAARLGERIQRAAPPPALVSSRAMVWPDSIESTHVFFTVIRSPETISTTSEHGAPPPDWPAGSIAKQPPGGVSGTTPQPTSFVTIAAGLPTFRKAERAHRPLPHFLLAAA